MSERLLPAWSLTNEAAGSIGIPAEWPEQVTRDWAIGGATGEGVDVCILDSGIDQNADDAADFEGHGIARSLVEVAGPAGTVVIREGDAGDRFYVIGEGEVEIGGRSFGPGNGFGEIALLQDVPRTATVTAVTDVTLHALERNEFIAAVTGHEPANAAADAIIAARLGAFDPSAAPR